MTAKKKDSADSTARRGRSIWQMIGLIPVVSSLVRGAWYKLKVETCLALKNVIVLLVLALILACLLTASWISLLAVVFFSLLKLQWAWYTAAALVMLFNVIGLLLLCLGINRVKNKLLKLIRL